MLCILYAILMVSMFIQMFYWVTVMSRIFVDGFDLIVTH